MEEKEVETIEPKKPDISMEDVLNIMKDLKGSIETINTHFNEQLKKQDEKIKNFADNYMTTPKEVVKEVVVKDEKEDWDDNDDRWWF